MLGNHIVIASYHGVGEALDVFVRDENTSSFEWFVYLQCDQTCRRTPPIGECVRRDSCHLSYLANVGRESRVYLHHILMMYHHLPPLLYFLQENEMPKLTLGVAPAWNRNVLYPARSSVACAGGRACGANFCWKGNSLGPVTNRIMRIVFDRPCRAARFDCALRASFVVRRDGILQHPVSTYIALTRLAENGTWTPTPHGCKKGMLYGDYAAHAFERLWDTLFETDEHRLV